MRRRILSNKTGMNPNYYIEWEVNNVNTDGFIVPFSAYNLTGQTPKVDIYVNDLYISTPSITSGNGLGVTLLANRFNPGINNVKIVRNETSPKDIGWARGFGFHNGVTGCNTIVNKGKLIRVLNDPGYAYCESERNTGIYFKACQYISCRSLISIPDETLPHGIEIIDNYYYYNSYYMCSMLQTTAKEYLPNSVTLIGNYYRESMYYGCQSLQYCNDESISNQVKSIGNSYRYQQYRECAEITYPAAEDIPDSVTSIGGWFRDSQYYGCSSLVLTTPEVMSSQIKFNNIDNGFRQRQYINCRLIKVGTHIHHHLFSSLLNAYSFHYLGMFSVDTALSQSDTMPKYYISATATTTAPVTNITPNGVKQYVTNRTGITGYASLHTNWR